MAHFMALPRELRDMVYENLYESACFTWKTSVWDTPSAKIECAKVPVPKAVIPGLQATQEYLQTKFIRELEVTIHLNADVERGWPVNMMRRAPVTKASTIQTFQASELLGHAKHLTLLVTVKAPGANKCGFAWQKIMELMETFSMAKLRFSTIKLGIHYAAGDELPFWPQGHPPILEAVRTRFDPSTNPWLPQDMTAIQRIAAYRIELHDLYTGRRQNVVLEHKLVKIEAHLYATNQSLASGRLWTREEVMDVFPVREVPPGRTRHWAALSADELERYTWAKNSLKEWRESKGSQTYIWAKKDLWTNEEEDESEDFNS